jgi:23S rRNA (uridine2552-2'-O)-methyltransferase
VARRRRHQDHFGRRAQREGKAARSIFKLEEIDERWRLIRRGAVVLDLGCAPGSWMQYVAQRVGPSGRVIGYDLTATGIVLPANADARVGDAFDIPAEDLPPRVDVLLSDMAPSTTGNHATDALRSASLVERALDIADQHLAAGGNVVLKLLEGGEVQQLVTRMRATYEKLERLRPRATRKHSTEIFLVGIGKRAVAPAV